VVVVAGMVVDVVAGRDGWAGVVVVVARSVVGTTVVAVDVDVVGSGSAGGAGSWPRLSVATSTGAGWRAGRATTMPATAIRTPTTTLKGRMRRRCRWDSGSTRAGFDAAAVCSRDDAVTCAVRGVSPR
jgi:hypothetical protein